MEVKKSKWDRLIWTWKPASEREAGDSVVRNLLLHWFPAKVTKESLSFRYSFWLGTVSALLFCILGGDRRGADVPLRPFGGARVPIGEGPRIHRLFRRIHPRRASHLPAMMAVVAYTWRAGSSDGPTKTERQRARTGH